MRDTSKDFYKKLLGRTGEVKAEKFLKRLGYKILAKNYKTVVGEIDIIAKDGDTVVFVEVKTRTNEKYGAPSEAVGVNKRMKYFKVAEEYLIKNYKTTDVLCRFDVIETLDGQINHIINAFSC